MSNFGLKGGAAGAHFPAEPENLAVTVFVNDMVTGLRVGASDEWYRPFAHSPPRTAQKTVINYPISGMRMAEHTGSVNREEQGAKQKAYFTLTYSKGAHCDSRKLRMGDVTAWSSSPAALYTAANKQMGILLGALWTLALASPGSVLDAWGQPWLTATASQRFNNPFKPEYGSHTNLTTGQAFTQPNIMAACNRLRQRRGTDGRFLGLKPKYLLVPNALGQEADLFTHKRMLVPNVAGTAGGNTSDLYEYLEPIVSLELPENLWGVLPDMSGLTPEEMPFVTIRGVGAPLGNVSVGAAMPGQAPTLGDGGVSESIIAPSSGIPEFEVRYWGTNSALFEVTEKVAVDVYYTGSIDAQDGRFMEMCTLP